MVLFFAGFLLLCFFPAVFDRLKCGGLFKIAANTTVKSLWICDFLGITRVKPEEFNGYYYQLLYLYLVSFIIENDQNFLCVNI